MRANYEDLSNGLHKAEKYLIRFLSNLLLGENNSLKNREMHIQYIDSVITQNDTVKSKNETVNDTVNDTVFHLIMQNNKITAVEISYRLKISISTAKRKLKELKESGRIERTGSDKTGFWKVIEK